MHPPRRGRGRTPSVPGSPSFALSLACAAAGPLVLALACGASSRKSSSPAPVDPLGASSAAGALPSQSASASSGEATSGLVTAPERELARVEPAGEPACVLESQEWAPDGDESVLRLRKGGQPFARPTKAQARIEIPLGKDAESVFARLARNGWEVAGYLGTEEFSLRPSRALVFDGFLAPLPMANLDWEEARPGELVVTVAPSRGIKTTAGMLRAPHPCADLTLDERGSFDPESVVPKAAAPRDGILRARPGIPLSLTPGSAPVAWLDPPNGDEQVKVLESRGAFVRIAWTHFEQIVFGWVPVGDVRTRGGQSTARYGIIGALGGGAAGDSPLSSSVTRYRCEADVPLVADIRGEPVVVGQILHGTRIDARDRMGGFVRVVLPPTAPVAPLEGVSFEVQASSLAACTAER